MFVCDGGDAAAAELVARGGRDTDMVMALALAQHGWDRLWPGVSA